MKRYAAFLLAIGLAIVPGEKARAGYSVIADDGYVYVTHPDGKGFAVSVFDIEAPSAPSRVRTIRAEGVPTTPLTLSGDVGYIGNGKSLHVIDLSCPERAAFIRTIRDGFHGQTVRGAHAEGSHLVVEGDGEVRLYDISDPFAPILSDTLPTQATSPLAATFRFTPLFSDGTCRINELTQDGFVGRGLAGIMPNSTCFFVSSCVLYETDRTSVRIHDLSLPGNPTIRPFTNSVMRPVASHPRGRLWVLHKGELESWNVWRPLSPRFQKRIPFPFPDLLTNGFIRGDYCYANDLERNALRVFSLADGKAVERCECPLAAGEDGNLFPRPLPAALETPSLPKADLVTDGSLLFATIGAKGDRKAIGIHRILEPGRTVPVADIPLERPVCGLAICPGTNLLCAVDGSALHVFSFSPEGKALREASLPITEFEPYGPQDVAIDPRGIALLACRMDGVKSVNLADLSALAVTDADTTAGFARNIACAGGNVYVADDTAGVTIHALSEDGALELFRTIPLPYGSAAGIVSYSNRVYATGQELPLASFTTSPRPLCIGLCETGQDASFELGAEALDVALVEGTGTTNATMAFVLDRKQGLLLCDATDPTRMELLGPLPQGSVPGSPLAITSHGTTAYLLIDSGEIRRLEATEAPPAGEAGKMVDVTPAAEPEGTHEP